MKLGRTTKIRQNFFFYHLSPFSSFRTTKIRQNFFVPSAHSIILDTSVSSLHGSTRLSVSLSSSVSAFDSILANRSSTAQPVLQVSLYSFLRIARPLRLPPVHPSTSFVASTSSLSTVQVSYGLLFPPVWGFLLRPPLQVRFVAFLFV